MDVTWAEVGGWLAALVIVNLALWGLAATPLFPARGEGKGAPALASRLLGCGRLVVAAPLVALWCAISVPLAVVWVLISWTAALGARLTGRGSNDGAGRAGGPGPSRGRVEGRALVDDTPVAGLRVTLQGLSRSGESSSATTTTDADGAFVFEQVPSGEVMRVACQLRPAGRRPAEGVEAIWADFICPPGETVRPVLSSPSPSRAGGLPDAVEPRIGLYLQSILHLLLLPAATAASVLAGLFSLPGTWKRFHAWQQEEHRARRETVESLTCETRRADGTPLAGARLVVAAGRHRVLRDGEPPSSADVFTTDREGRCTLPARESAYALAVLHDEGYAELDSKELARTPEVTLRPWARVTGTLYDADAPAGNEEVVLWTLEPTSLALPFLTSSGSFQHESRVLTDAGGGFAFDRVPPDQEVFVADAGSYDDQENRYDSRSARGEPGETLQVRLETGDAGASVD